VRYWRKLDLGLESPAVVVVVVGVGEESKILMASIWSETSSNSRPEGRGGGVLEVSPGAIFTVGLSAGDGRG